jgi:hypothetical protein
MVVLEGYDVEELKCMPKTRVYALRIVRAFQKSGDWREFFREVSDELQWCGRFGKRNRLLLLDALCQELEMAGFECRIRGLK